MTKHSKYNLVYRLQKWMDTVDGQTFLNYAYSWGASVVILGALFKLTHLPGANIMLFVGMGTEVFVFFISAFDRPFDKTADGRDIPTHMTEEYLASGQFSYTKAEQKAAAEEAGTYEPAQTSATDQSQPAGTVAPQSAHVYAASPQPMVQPQPAVQSQTAAPTQTMAQSLAAVEAAQSLETSAQSATAQPQPNFVPQMSEEEAKALNEAQGNYVEELKALVETLKKVNEQSERLTRDSEEMENLNRTLTGISKVYEMQLKGASQQIGTIDQINDQTRKMAQQIEQLNQIYARMIQAMTVNMKAAAPLQQEQQ
jgi:gliding motility-associated protein GldL